jgi:hypothetical protein
VQLGVAVGEASLVQLRELGKGALEQAGSDGPDR